VCGAQAGHALLSRAMLTFYDAPVSGNTYKVRLLLRQLKIPHEVVWLDILKGEVRGDEFRRRNPFGRVPYIDHDGFGLAESNAILLYLARGSRLLPDDVRTQALVAQWMFFEQNQVELSIGIPRFLRAQGKDPGAVGEHYAPRAKAALKVLEQHLLLRHWLVGEAYSIADIAMFAYSHLAPDAGHDLSQYPALSAWMARVCSQPGWFALE
jgi:glutathione S-transferase